MSLAVIPDKAQYVLVCNTVKTVRRVVSFTAMNVTNKCVNMQKRTPEESRYQCKNHKVVTYNQRKPQRSVEKFRLHKTRNIEIYGKNRIYLLCCKCVVKKGHSSHTLEDFQDIYAEKNINVVKQKSPKTLSNSSILKMEMNKNEIETTVMDDIRQFTKTESESLKESVDRATSKKIERQLR